MRSGADTGGRGPFVLSCATEIDERATASQNRNCDLPLAEVRAMVDLPEIYNGRVRPLADACRTSFPAQHSGNAAMTIDWVLVLAPLAALPLVLLFAFVGCGAPDLTFDLDPIIPISLYLPDLATVFEITSLEVSVQYTPANLSGSFTVPGLPASQLLVLSAIYSGGLLDVGSALGLSTSEAGELDCTCNVSLVGAAMFPPGPASWSVFMDPVAGDRAYFFLFRNNGNFGLTGVTVPG